MIAVCVRVRKGVVDYGSEEWRLELEVGWLRMGCLLMDCGGLLVCEVVFLWWCCWRRAGYD
jgi:hypothetical protein